MSDNQNFVHLHVHTEFSLLDGLSRINKLVNRAQELEMPALAITDHGTMFGVIDFYRAAKNAGVKPIIGLEAYLAPRGMEDRDPQIDKKPFHLLLLAKNETGYRNLLKIASESQLRGYYYRPRIDFDFLAQHSEGLVCTSGCLAAKIPRLVAQGQDDEARRWIGQFQEVFGAENFYLELQQHDIPEIDPLNRWLVDYAASGHTPVGLLATSDVHYVLEGDFQAHDTLLCIQTSALKSTPKRKDHDNEEGTKTRMALSDNSYYLTSYDEMMDIFGDINGGEPVHNSLKIAEMCNLDLDTDDYHLPNFPVPHGHDAKSYLRYLCDIGMDWRFGSRKTDTVLVERLNRELDIIHDMGFDTYFLIVWDLCEYARHADIWWNVRGSGAGSLAAYCLGITNIDPIHNNLLFERFLNPGRVSMPDIDLDYPDDRRGEMIAYTARKYGEDKVAAIITFGTMGAKAAIKDVARVYDIPLPDVNRVVGHIPTEARQKKIADYVQANPDLQKIYDNEPELRTVIDMAKELQGVSRHTSVHAAGVIVADQPLVEYLPLHRMAGKDNSDGALKAVTQFPMETAESIGLLKVDFLGLSTLTILRKACDLVKRYHGIDYNMDNIPYRHDDDSLTEEQLRMLDDTFMLLGRGETVGVFQLESTGMQQMLRGMRPKQFENIVAAVSLYRPGPMEFIPQYNKRLHGEEEPTYKHDKLRPILEETYAIIIYQEQVMQIASDLFGYELGEADLMRRAVSKKKAKELVKHRDIFIQRGPENGVPETTANAIFDEIEFFANYGFNKSHASDYAVITVQTAFLKTHYTAEYMTALLSVQRDDSAKVSTFLDECRRLHIPIMPPDVNFSELDFTIEEAEGGRRAIRFGLEAIKNAGANALQPIVDARHEGGPFRDLTDFAQRVDLRHVGKRTLESLVKVGALASILDDRPRLLEAIDQITGYSASYHRDLEVGQMNMFGAAASGSDSPLGDLPNPQAPPTQRDMLLEEKELLGLYVTGRPVDKFREDLRHLNTADVAHIKSEEMQPVMHERDVMVAGEIIEMRKVFTKNGDAMGVLKIEDWRESAAAIEVVLFPRAWAKAQAQVESEEMPEIVVGEVFKVQGKFDVSRGDPQIIAESLSQNFTVMTAAKDDHHTMQVDDMARAAWADDADSPVEDFAPPGANGHHTNGHSNGSVMPPEPPPLDIDDPAHIPPEAWSPEDEGGSVQADGPEPEYTQNGDDEDWFIDDEDDDVSAVSSRWLVVRMPRTDDEERDRRFLQRLHNIITQTPGNDRFVIQIQVGDRPYTMRFKETTKCSKQLIAEVADLVGLDNVDVRETL